MTLLKYVMPLLLLFSNAGFARVHILGIQRSGTHLLCYSLAKIVQKPILTVPTSDKPRARMIFQDIHQEKAGYQVPIEELTAEEVREAMWFGHHPKAIALDEADPSRDYLIVIVRDYHECLTSNVSRAQDGSGFKKQRVFDALYRLRIPNSFENPYATSQLDYINTLRCYDEWNPKTRILVYYEDLMTDFENTILSCLQKLDLSPEEFKECTDNLAIFLKQLAIEKERTKEIYKSQGGVISGDDLQFYQKKYLGRESSIEMDNYLKYKFPYYWEKYVNRYAVNW